MNVNPIKVNITLDPAKEGKWYAKENVTKRGDTEVTFFQRDGKRTLLQKIKDFRNGVRYGTELASKYSKELGLPKEALLNPKNKSEKPMMSNDELNKMFRTAHEKLQKNESFQISEPLVNHIDKDIYIKINKASPLHGENYINNTLNLFKIDLQGTNHRYEDFESHIKLALDIRADPSFPADSKKIDKAINALNDLKTTRLIGTVFQDPKVYENLTQLFNEKVDMLIASLNTALKKISNDSPTN